MCENERKDSAGRILQILVLKREFFLYSPGLSILISPSLSKRELFSSLPKREISLLLRKDTCMAGTHNMYVPSRNYV